MTKTTILIDPTSENAPEKRERLPIRPKRKMVLVELSMVWSQQVIITNPWADT